MKIKIQKKSRKKDLNQNIDFNFELKLENDKNKDANHPFIFFIKKAIVMKKLYFSQNL